MSLLISYILLLWTGITIGVSFIATPAKFLAPHLSLSNALEVGKATFHVFKYIEWGIYGIILFMIFYFHFYPFSYYMGIGTLGLILVLQTFWLLPILDKNVGIISNGGHPKSSLHHLYYVTLEVLKIVIAGATSWKMMKWQ